MTNGINLSSLSEIEETLSPSQREGGESHGYLIKRYLVHAHKAAVPERNDSNQPSFQLFPQLDEEVFDEHLIIKSNETAGSNPFLLMILHGEVQTPKMPKVQCVDQTTAVSLCLTNQDECVARTIGIAENEGDMYLPQQESDIELCNMAEEDV